MKLTENKLIGGGGNGLKPSHNHGLRLFLRCLDARMRRGKVCIKAARQLRCYAAKVFNYNHERGLSHELNNRLDCHAIARNDEKCHTEGGSPKYRMVGKVLSLLRSFAVQKRILSKECNIMAESNVRSTAQDDVKILCHPELDSGSINADLSVGKEEPSLAFVTFASAHEQLLPLTVREGKNFAASLLSGLAAFTLAEVLVTLGIIGVVSAMTVPTLMQNYQRQSYVTQLHKTYNEFSQALLRYQTDRNALNLTEAGLTSQDAVNDFIRTYFKNVKECDTMNNCFASSYKATDGATISNYAANAKSYVFANGVSIRPLYAKSGAKIINMGLDINGQKGPNIGGRDLFWFYIYNNGLIDDAPIDENTVAPMTTEQRNTQFNSKCLNHEGSPDGCFGKILNDNWQMNY